MEKMNLKRLVIDYYDSLINRIDIHAEELLKNYTVTDLLQVRSSSPIEANKSSDTHHHTDDCPKCYGIESYHLAFVDDDEKIEIKQEASTNEFVPGSTRVLDYINATRDEMIKRVRDAQTETLEHMKMMNKELEAGQNDEATVIVKLFAKRSPILLQVEKFNIKELDVYKPVFMLYLVDLDFCMTKKDIDCFR